MRHVITGVADGSVAQRHGLLVGDVLLQINGEAIQDEIDYQALSAQPDSTLTFERNGRQKMISLIKEDWEPLGLQFGDSMVLKPRTCRNDCIFCFVNQMAPNMRPSLYVKDDDWRFSLMMGNYITLTNIDETEFQRILKRHASPLYISVHTTDPELRKSMMHNRFAGDIMQRLQRLKDGGIRFHCQIVCCPGVNDGDILMQTLNDLASLIPAAQSVAIVPVGLTKFRDNLPKITPFSAASAKAFLRQIQPFQEQCLRRYGTSFAFPSDEFYCLSGEPLPPDEWYEDYPQIENGVGMLRRFEEQMKEAAEDDTEEPSGEAKTFVIPTGVSAAAHMERLSKQFAPPNTTVYVVTIYNHYFGETITVTGLLTGGDLLQQLPVPLLQQADKLLLSANTLRHERDLFLDDMPLDTFQQQISLPVRLCDDGYDFYNALHNR